MNRRARACARAAAPAAARAAAVVAAFLAAAAQAQQLAPVTVTATRTEASPFDVPAAVDVIDGSRAREAGRPEINVSESLATVPAVTARDRQNFAQDLQLSIRGFGARSTFGVRGVRVYVDGIPATMPDGQGQLSHIDLASAGRIEVLRGPFSALYGNSSGGVMQVFTERGEGAPVVSSSLAVGSDGLVRPGMRASGSQGGIGYSLSANHLETNGSREHSGAQRGIANARLDMGSANGGHWMLVANTLDLRADDPLGLSRAQFLSHPRGVDTPALQFDTRKTVRQSQVGVTYELPLDGATSLRSMVYAGERATTQFQSIPVAPQGGALHPGGVIGLSRQYAGADVRLASRSQIGAARVEWIAGIAADQLWEHRQGWQNFIGSTLGVQGALRRDEENRVMNFDPYVQGTWTFAPHWLLTAGVRHSSVRFASHDRYVAGPNGDDSGFVRYSATLPVVALMHEVSRQLHVYAAAGRGFETPTFNELAYRPDGLPGLNFALRPSRSRNVEAGVKGRGAGDGPWHSQWNVAVFRTETAGELVTQTNTGGRSTFQNAGATVRRGVEAAWSLQSDRGLTLQLAQTWLDARYASPFVTCTATPCAAAGTVIPGSNRIPGTARSMSAAEVAWKPDVGWQAGTEVRHASRVWTNDSNSEFAPAYTTLSLWGGYAARVQRWNLSAALRVENVLDKTYAGSVIVNEGNGRYYEPAPGRNFVLKLSAAYAF